LAIFFTLYLITFNSNGENRLERGAAIVRANKIIVKLTKETKTFLLSRR